MRSAECFDTHKKNHLRKNLKEKIETLQDEVGYYFHPQNSAKYKSRRISTFFYFSVFFLSCSFLLFLWLMIFIFHTAKKEEEKAAENFSHKLDSKTHSKKRKRREESKVEKRERWGVHMLYHHVDENHTVQRRAIQLSKCHEIKERGNFSRNFLFFLTSSMLLSILKEKKPFLLPKTTRQLELDPAANKQNVKSFISKGYKFWSRFEYFPARICWKSMKYECSLSFFRGAKVMPWQDRQNGKLEVLSNSPELFFPSCHVLWICNDDLSDQLELPLALFQTVLDFHCALCCHSHHQWEFSHVRVHLQVQLSRWAAVLCILLPPLSPAVM